MSVFCEVKTQIVGKNDIFRQSQGFLSRIPFSYLFLKNLPKFLQKQLRRTRKLPMFLPADV